MRTLFRRTRRKMTTWIRRWLERGRRVNFFCFWGQVTWFGRLILQTCRRIVFLPRRALLGLNLGGNEAEEENEPQNEPHKDPQNEPHKDPQNEAQNEPSVAEGESGGPPEGAEDGFDSKEYQVDDTDELYCMYDSTWETKKREDPPRSRKRRSNLTGYNQQDMFRRFTTAAKDMSNYRHDYPQLNKAHSRKPQSPDDSPNLKFYLEEAPCLPDDVYISEIHEEWWGDYDKLESVHTYIQWLFPLQEPGMNYQASTLTKQEIQDFCQNTKAKQNLLQSYKLMLDFYGIELKDEVTGAVTRARNWNDRFDNLNSRTHNNLRLTRILKCLGTLGYRHYQAPLVHFFLEETLVHGELPDVKESVLNYFVFAVLDKEERRKLLKFAYTYYNPKEEFVWCPKKIQEVWSRMQDGTSDAASDHDGEARNNGHDELAAENNYEEF